MSKCGDDGQGRRRRWNAAGRDGPSWLPAPHPPCTQGAPLTGPPSGGHLTREEACCSISLAPRREFQMLRWPPLPSSVAVPVTRGDPASTCIEKQALAWNHCMQILENLFIPLAKQDRRESSLHRALKETDPIQFPLCSGPRY